MKTKSGKYRMTKAALVLILFITVQTAFGQILGIYSKHSKKKSLKRQYKCEKVGVQKVKHIQGKAKSQRPIAFLAPSNEVIMASIVRSNPALEQTKEEFNNLSNIVDTPKEEQKKDSVEGNTFRLMPLPVYFRYDSYRLDIIDLTQIALAVTYVKEGHAITLVGHTDNWGSEKYNEVLSHKRANIIRDMMIELGCKPELIKARGEGEKYPATTNDHEEGRQSNRRVEFLIALN